MQIWSKSINKQVSYKANKYKYANSSRKPPNMVVWNNGGGGGGGENDKHAPNYFIEEWIL